ncbi:MAG: PH domain-containing protein [Planctomycetota bacterium]|nr:PH domain-containing protein [Planctomycetota bacterium]
MSANASMPVSEQVYYEGHVPVRAYLARWGCLGMLLFGWNIGLVIAWLQSLSLTIKITSQRLVLIRGLLAQTEEDVPLYRVVDCGFSQNICERLLGVGRVWLASDDASAPRLDFSIVTPQSAKEFIRECAMRERQRMRTLSVD